METITLSTKHLHFTDDDFYTFCMDNPDLKFERDSDGKIMIMANTGGETGDTNSEINMQLRIWNKQHKLGRVFDSSTAFRLPNGAVRSPDLAWVNKEKWNFLTNDEKKKFPPLCPDFIVELKSPSDELADIQRKMTDQWIGNGCRLAWLIDPDNKNVFVYQSGKEMEIINNFDNIVSGGEVLPGFELNLKELIN